MSTILETYDTQMLDSGDYDMTMHTAGSSWPYSSDIMDEDHHHDSQSLGAADLESVEVEMEEYQDDDNESIEYEMADEEHIDEGEALLDVEVYDVSVAHSPAVPSVEVTESISDPAFSTADVELGHHEEIHSRADEELLPAGTPPILSPHSHVHDLSAEIKQQVTEVSSLEITEHAATDLNVASEQEPNPDVEDAAEPEAHHSEDPAFGIAAQENEHSVSVPTEQQAEPPVQHDSEQPHDELEYQPETEDSADPHEISEGVYIDPPPAVLLSLPLLDHPGLYLFNYPVARSGSRSPVDETNEAGAALIMLLNHRPTLYYEPLTNVFEALRQEEYLASIPDFIEGELILDIYDLQLVVSEDNAHARDVTLHDLNVLHDGSDLSGPLRLHLHIVTPRFILRYHLLRDQISRLNVTQAEEEIEAYDRQEEHHELQCSNEEEQATQHGINLQENSQVSTDGQEETLRALNEGVRGNINNSYSAPEEPVLRDEDPQLAVNGLPAPTDEAPSVDGSHEKSAANTEPEHVPVLEEEEPSNNEGDRVTQEEVHEQHHAEYNFEGAADFEGDNQSEKFQDLVDEHSKTERDAEALPGPVTNSTGQADEGQEVQGELLPSQDGEEALHELNDLSEESLGGLNEENGLNDTTLGIGGADESDFNFITMLERQAHSADLITEASITESYKTMQQSGDPEPDFPEFNHDEEWDEDLDAEGDLDVSWQADGDDGVSNQSSVTLSSSSSVSKRHFEDVDPDDLNDDTDRLTHNTTPEFKRPRVE